MYDLVEDPLEKAPLKELSKDARAGKERFEKVLESLSEERRKQ